MKPKTNEIRKKRLPLFEEVILLTVSARTCTSCNLENVPVFFCNTGQAKRIDGQEGGVSMSGDGTTAFLQERESLLLDDRSRNGDLIGLGAGCLVVSEIFALSLWLLYEHLVNSTTWMNLMRGCISDCLGSELNLTTYVNVSQSDSCLFMVRDLLLEPDGELFSLSAGDDSAEDSTFLLARH